MGETQILITASNPVYLGLWATTAGLPSTTLGGLSQDYCLLLKHNHSAGRAYHAAWTSPSDSIVLLGGHCGAELTAEILPGI